MKEEEIKTWIADAIFNVEQLERVILNRSVDVNGVTQPFLDGLKLSLYKINKVLGQDNSVIKIFSNPKEHTVKNGQ